MVDASGRVLCVVKAHSLEAFPGHAFPFKCVMLSLGQTAATCPLNRLCKRLMELHVAPVVLASPQEEGKVSSDE